MRGGRKADIRAILCLVLLAASILSSMAMAGENEVIARVNGVEVKESHVNLLKELLLFSETNQAWSQSPALTKEALKSAVSLELVYQDAVNINTKIPKSGVDALVWDYITGFATRKEYWDSLAALGATEEELKAQAEKVITASVYLQALYRSRLNPGDREALAFYKENPQKFQLPEAVRARHILISTQNQKRTREQAMLLAQKARERISKGEPIALVAREVSEGPEKNAGGDFGYVAKGTLVNTELEPLESVIMDLEPGGIGPVVETDIGFHVVQAMDVRPKGITPYETVRDQLINFLGKKAFIDVLNERADLLEPRNQVETLVEFP